MTSSEALWVIANTGPRTKELSRWLDLIANLLREVDQASIADIETEASNTEYGYGQNHAILYAAAELVRNRCATAKDKGKGRESK